jgi:hypothetical protein
MELRIFAHIQWEWYLTLLGMQVAMYRLSCSAAGGFELKVVSSGLYTLPGRLEQMVAFDDEDWGNLCTSRQKNTRTVFG